MMNVRNTLGMNRSEVCLFRLGAQAASSMNTAQRKISRINLLILVLIMLFFSTSVNWIKRCISAVTHLIYVPWPLV